MSAAQDVGNIIFLEHLTLEVPDLEVARLFYEQGLGLTQDPGTLAADRGGLNVVWYNIGRQQLHICKGPTAQTLPLGSAIGLVLPRLAAVAERLERVRQVLGDMSITYLTGCSPGSQGAGGPNHSAAGSEQPCTGDSSGPGGSCKCLEVTDPYGNCFVLHDTASYVDEVTCLAFPAAAGGIAYCLLPCHVGSSAGIAKFYETVLQARVMHKNISAVAVVTGAGSSLRFQEMAHLGERADESVARQHSGWHAAMYVADFGGVYERLAAHGLIDNQHPYRDKCHSLEDALRNRQLRFKNVVGQGEDAGAGAAGDGGSAPLLFCLGHEVRSTFHPRFMRPLYNRGWPNFDA